MILFERQQLFGTVLAAVAGLATLGVTTSQAIVVISDGFGDADRNNNGIPLEQEDVNLQGTNPADSTYVPGRLQNDPPTGLEPENNEVTSVLDSRDIGIRWLNIRGFTNASVATIPGSGLSKPSLRILDDTQGAQLETQPVENEGGLGIDALDSGYALSWQSRGRGATAAGFFDQKVSLGTQVGDTLKVSFDYRLWRDADNAETLSVDEANIRFGLFQDTDDQLGETNPFAGRQVDEFGDPVADPFSDFVPAVWGQDEGLFDGQLANIGPDFDIGSTVEGPVGDNFPAGLDNGGTARIREELQADRILQGQDVEFVESPENMAADPLNDPPLFDFVDLDSDKVYNIELSLTRATDVTPGDSILARLSVTERLSGVTKFFEGLENDPGSDSFDYFAIRNNGDTSSDEFDMLIDNFTIEITGSNEVLPGDFNGDNVVDAADYTIWRDNLGAAESVIGDAGDGSGVVDAGDYLVWDRNFGRDETMSSTAVPEPAGLAVMAMACIGMGLSRRR